MNIMNSFSLKGKTAVVTGALGLLGKEHCYALSEAGASVIAADLDSDACYAFAKTLDNNSSGIRLDVTDKSSLAELKDLIIKMYGGIDILVNNAAVNDMFENPVAAAETSKFENYPQELWEKSFNVNVKGVFLACQVLGSEMALRGSGSIINIASTYGIVAPDQTLYKSPAGEQKFYKSASYPATKAAVIALTKYLAAYWGNRNVRVNTLSPGGVENNQDSFFISNYSSKTPLGRMAKKTDYKGALLFLASDSSSYMTGANLVIDGGWTVW